MQQHNQKQRQILQRVPSNGAVPASAHLDFDERNEKPGPMQKDVDSGNVEQMNRT
jgi:hypothetical protein